MIQIGLFERSLAELRKKLMKNISDPPNTPAAPQSHGVSVMLLFHQYLPMSLLCLLLP